jgi:hypothetical protein
MLWRCRSAAAVGWVASPVHGLGDRAPATRVISIAPLKISPQQNSYGGPSDLGV